MILSQTLIFLFCLALTVQYGFTQEEEAARGCVDDNGQSHAVDSLWDQGQVQLKCIQRKERYFAKPVACITENGDYVEVGKSEKFDAATFACIRDGEHTCSLHELKVSYCYDHENQAYNVGDTWNDEKFRYSCVVNEANEAVTKIEGVIIQRK